MTPPESSVPALPRPEADRTIVSSRVFSASVAEVFAAFRDPARLTLWWGPRDFTNTIHVFDPYPGGRWRLTMQGPSGDRYENESEFLEVTAPHRVVFRHLDPVHRFDMTMTFVPEGAGTRVTWRMAFEDPADYANSRNFVVEANEQNFDRLAAHLAGKKS